MAQGRAPGSASSFFQGVFLFYLPQTCQSMLHGNAATLCRHVLPSPNMPIDVARQRRHAGDVVTLCRNSHGEATDVEPWQSTRLKSEEALKSVASAQTAGARMGENHRTRNSQGGYKGLVAE